MLTMLSEIKSNGQSFCRQEQQEQRSFMFQILFIQSLFKYACHYADGFVRFFFLVKCLKHFFGQTQFGCTSKYFKWTDEISKTFHSPVSTNWTFLLNFFLAECEQVHSVYSKLEKALELMKNYFQEIGTQQTVQWLELSF